MRKTIKRSFILIAFSIISLFSFSQKVIQLTKQNGVYTIPCSINGVKRLLVFDTGASSVTISMQLAKLLYNSGQLKDTDIKGFGKSQVASGHIINNMSIVLRDVEISGMHLKNVDAVIIEGQNVPLLLGLSAIQKLGKVTLSGNKLIVDNQILDNPQISKLRTEIELLIDDNNFKEALVLLKQIEAQEATDEIDIYNLALCYCYSHDYNKALMYSQQWMGNYKDIGSPHEPDVCYFTALAYKGFKKYYDADFWFSEAIKRVDIGQIDKTSFENAITLSNYYNQKGVNYLEGNAYDLCVECFDMAAQYRIHVLGYSPDDIFRGIVKDERTGKWFYSISQLNAVYLHDDEKAGHYAVMAALCGNKDAQKFCDYFKLSYNPQHYIKNE